MTAPRTGAERKRDTLARLENDVDAWVATADEGLACMVPLSYLWDGDTLLMATPADSPTGRGLRSTGRARVGIGPTRDVVLIDGTVEAVLAPGDVSGEVGDAFAAKTGFDAREDGDWLYFRIRPRWVRAWREVNELRGRDLMREGEWIV